VATLTSIKTVWLLHAESRYQVNSTYEDHLQIIVCCLQATLNFLIKNNRNEIGWWLPGVYPHGS